MIIIAFDRIGTEPGWDKDAIAQSSALKHKLNNLLFHARGFSNHFWPH